MSNGQTAEDHADAARAEFHQAIMAAFCHALRTTQLPPITVLGLVAMALGSVYQEVAEAHRGDNACPCGWQPDPGADVEALQAALAAMIPSPHVTDLLTMQALGRA
ncbi:hypothetical protein [Phreatobacter stygius]|uniref:Uncharacterized protein n=1 Tax=Phreatobacter stygius TaxID=1940610 RepID=A0A4D7BKJ5_9HYPH|nr:hypothetical protein [Phreatobacter stygius]QCI68272.1 hypothetical protein E8M01_31035 [Phreatobacter stygius]